MTKELAKTLTTALVQFIDENRPEGTMDCSSGECERLEKAFEIYNLDFVERFIEKKLSRLTEFEKGLINFYNKSKEIPSDKDGVYNKHDLEEFLHESAKTLLALAREQFKPEIDAEIEKAYKTQDNVVFHKGWEQGRAEALKDLPKWRRDDSIEAEQYITVGKNGNRFHYKGHSLLISDLTKLPGFNED